MSATATRTAFRTCPLCEAGCGLEIGLAGDDGDTRVTRIRGDRDDVFSHGFICPKGSTLQAAPRGPRPAAPPAGQARRRASSRSAGTRRSPRSSAGLLPVIDAHGRDAVAVYLGNPNAHNARRRCSTCGRSSGRSAPRNVFSASTVDQRPKEVSSGLMFGGGAHRPGARPRPHRLPADARRQPVRVQRQPRPPRPTGPGRIEALRRAGRHGWSSSTRGAPAPPRRPTQHVADPARHRRLPAHGAWSTCCSPRARRPRRGWPSYVDRRRRGRCALAAAVHARGRGRRRPASTPTTIRGLARELAAAPTAVRLRAHRHAPRPSSARSRRGWSTCSTSLTGNLDRPGGAMFTKAAAGAANTRGTPRLRPGRAARTGAAAGCGACPRRWASCPVGVPGRGDRHARARARSGRWSPWPATRCCRRRTAAGSTPRSADLEFMCRVDIYVNETTRHADVILPAPVAAAEGPLRPRAAAARAAQRGQLQPAGAAARRRPARRVGDPGPAGARSLQGMGADADPAVVDDLMITARWSQARRGRRDQPDRRPRRRRDPRRCSAPRTGPERMLDLMLRTGPYGDGFGADPDGLTLDELLANPHGIDLGAARAPAARRAAHARRA